MPGRIVFTPSVKTLHDRNGCGDKPNAAWYADGTVWQCDECERKWRVESGTQYNETWHSWVKVAPQSRSNMYDR